jgi:hypothetical protein
MLQAPRAPTRAVRLRSFRNFQKSAILFEQRAACHAPGLAGRTLRRETVVPDAIPFFQCYRIMGCGPAWRLLERESQCQLPNASIYSRATDDAEGWRCETCVGIRKLVWFRALKNSARNSRLLLSTGHRSTTVFEKARSRFACPGPSTSPFALFQTLFRCHPPR